MQHESKPNPTKINLLEAAKRVLLAQGYSGLSTRAIAAAADTQMSQIRYHFGSKDGMVLALYEYMTDQLIARQTGLFTDPSIPLSEKWDVACDYLDEDIESGYVRVSLELTAVGWSNAKMGEALRASFAQWHSLHLGLAQEFKDTYGPLGPFDPEDIAALVGPIFIGAEAFILLGSDKKGPPIRRALRRIGEVIRYFEIQGNKGEE